MAGSPPDSGEAGSPGARIRAARHGLAAAALLFLGGSAFFALPLLYALVAIGVLLAIAAWLPRRPTGAGGQRAELPGAGMPSDAGALAAVEAFPKPAFLLDRSARVLHANSEAARLFPATRPGDAFTLTFRRPDFAEALGLAQAGQRTALEFREAAAGDSTYLVTLSPLDTSGSVGFLLVTFDDVSDRLAIARMRADFVANASHELRTPLAAVTGFIETLLGPARGDAAATEKFLHVMLEQAQRMRRLIDDLLSLSRAEMRARSRPTERVDLVAIVRQGVDAMQPLAAERGVALTVAASAARMIVVGDRDELAQVVQNLVENAVRYGGSGGRVELGLSSTGDRKAVLDVRDYGPGIAPEHLPRLTERFYRVDVGASREMKGTGLGLAIVKHILTRHSGALEIDSRPGEGARFSVVLPLAASESDH